MKNAATLSALAFAVGAAAHGGVYFYKLDGVEYEGYHPYDTPDGQSSIQRIWHTHDPILSVDLPTIACNDNGNTNPGQKRATATAGSDMLLTWNKDWAHDTGPLLAYLAKCPSDNCDEVDVNKLQWFKIAEEGLVSGSVENGLWANKKMMDNNFEWTAKIPASIPDGAYMLRTETIALHDVGSAQNYPQCAHVDIKGGSGVEVPAEYLVTFPGGYKQSDPGLDIDIYNDVARNTFEYIIPGPKVYTGEGSAAPAPQEPSEPAPAPTSTPEPSPEPVPSSSEEPAPEPTSTSTEEPIPEPTSTEETEPEPTQPSPTGAPGPVPPPPQTGAPSPVPPPSQTGAPGPVSPPSQTGAPGPVQTQWGQCAGNIWDGPTQCTEGTYCGEINEWYSQCIPNDYVEPEDGALWGKCGGRGYRGARTCPSGAQCVKVSRWYSECQPADE